MKRLLIALLATLSCALAHAEDWKTKSIRLDNGKLEFKYLKSSEGTYATIRDITYTRQGQTVDVYSYDYISCTYWNGCRNYGAQAPFEALCAAIDKKYWAHDDIKTEVLYRRPPSRVDERNGAEFFSYAKVSYSGTELLRVDIETVSYSEAINRKDVMMEVTCQRESKKR